MENPLHIIALLTILLFLAFLTLIFSKRRRSLRYLRRPARRAGTAIGEGMSMGIAGGMVIGLGIGLLMDNVAIGIAIGVGTGVFLGILFGIALQKKEEGYRKGIGSYNKRISLLLSVSFIAVLGLATVAFLLFLHKP